jgi:branched-chain amino acid aminotransferase
MAFVWLNGSLIAEDQAFLPLRDTGLLHAAGVFTTMRSYAGKVFRIDQHLARLRKSCDALFIPLQYKDDELVNATSELLKQNQLTEARLRLTVTRGSAKTDPIHGTHLSPNLFLTATALDLYPQEFYTKGMTVVLIDEQKLNPYDIQAGHKTLNYLSKLAALRSANQRGAGEALWFNVHNYLQSGSISNIFIVKDETIFTPPTPEELHDTALRESMPYPKSSVLPGITRATVIDLAQKSSIEVKLAALTVNDLLAADEVFLTNSIMQLMPVCRIERKTIGNEKPGVVTMKLSAGYSALT